MTSGYCAVKDGSAELRLQKHAESLQLLDKERIAKIKDKSGRIDTWVETLERERVGGQLLADPTQCNRQGNDIGSQYRSIILTENENELSIINQTKQKYQENLTAQSKGVLKTEIEILSNFFLAEDYHQKYLHKNPNGYCGLKGLNIKYF